MFLLLASRHIQNKNILEFNCVLLSLKQSSDNYIRSGISDSFDVTFKYICNYKGNH